MPSLDLSQQLADNEAVVSRLLTNHREIFNFADGVMQRTQNLYPLLPLMFRYNGEPVTLDTHGPFEMAFYHNRPRRMILKCARQVGKSFQQALMVLIRAIMIPNWNLLYVTPQFEQVRRFSTLYIRALIEESPIKRALYRKGFSAQVLQRTFQNNSTLFFNYAMRDANRTRGTNTNENFYDEVQLMFRDVLEILAQTMGGSKYGEYEAFAGTPLTPSNVIDQLFNSSTMSCWMIPCRSCGYENRASVEFDLLKMIGPVHDDIGEGFPGLVCARCSQRSVKNVKPIFPEDGRWYHRKPENRDSFLGMHIPQPIMPWHAYSRDRWLQLTNRLAGGSQASVFNECLGESADSSVKPISEMDLRRAAVLGHNGHSVHEAMAKVRSGNYLHLSMGIDWGGGGRANVSRTKAAIIGFTMDGKTDVIYGVDLNFAHNPFEEVRVLVMLAGLFRVHIIAHDIGGGIGTDRENMMRQSGMVTAELWPMGYTGSMRSGLIKANPIDAYNPVQWYSVDKAATLSFTCQAIKQGHIRLFDFDYVNRDNPGLLMDFTALYNEISRRSMGSDVLIVDREEGMSDDFAHAVNLGSVAIWAKHGCWPKLSQWQDFLTMQNIATLDSETGNNYTIDDVEAALQHIRTTGLVRV
jgi:hypothetical protein